MNHRDLAIVWLFASALVLPLAGEATMALYLLVMLALLAAAPWRQQAAPAWPWRALWLPAVAIGSITLVKLLSMLWSLSPPQSLRNAATHLHFVFFLPLALGFWRARQPLDALLRGVRLASIGLLAWSIWFWWRNGIGFDAMVRLEAGAQNAGVLGQLAGVQALWLAWHWRCQPRWGHLAWALTAMVPVLAAGGRSHVSVVLIGWVLITALVCRDRRSWAGRIATASVATLLLGVLVFAISPRMEVAWIEAIDYGSTPETSVGTSVGNRIGLWDAARHAFPHAPWLGFGAGTSREVVAQYTPLEDDHFAVTSHYHQQLLQVVMETGLIGLALCLWALVGLSRWFYARRAAHPFLWPGYVWLVFSTALVGMFTGSLQQGLLHSYIVATLAVLAAQALHAPSPSRTA